MADAQPQPDVAFELEREQPARPRRPHPAEVTRAGVEQLLQSPLVLSRYLPLAVVRAMVTEAQSMLGTITRRRHRLVHIDVDTTIELLLENPGGSPRRVFEWAPFAASDFSPFGSTPQWRN